MGWEMQLRNLTLEHLPMLKHIWSRKCYGSLRFQKLGQLKVVECKSLNHIFPFSVAKELPFFQMLHIEECHVENIVAQDEMADTVPILIFPKLTTLRLRSLTRLRSFCHGLHTLGVPFLRDLDVYHCDQLELFVPKSLNYPGNALIDPQALLSFEKVVPNLRELILNGRDVTMLCNSQLNHRPIYTVKALRLRCFHNEFDIFPSGFLQRFINLEGLMVTCSSFTEIFSSGSFFTGNSETTMKLTSLVLVELHSLEFICEDESEMQFAVQNLEVFEVFKCSILRTIFPSSVRFENLERVRVAFCVGLENIMSSSIATNLPKLRRLTIDNCETIEVIVASDKENEAGELAFMKLEFLRLYNLPKLRSFYKGRYSLKFPLLKKLSVGKCRMIETFSYGVLNAPKLRAVHLTYSSKGPWRWNIGK